METTKTILQPLAVQALAAKSQAVMADLPPWLEETEAPQAYPARRQHLRTMPAPEVVHWSVALLTLFTALSVLLGAFGAEARPRELLPIMITSAS